MKSLIAIMMLFTIVLCSLVQYHHHDKEGNIYIYTLCGEIEVGQHSSEPHHHDKGDTPCKHHHHHHDNHCGDSEDCAMHLDQLSSREKDIDISPEEKILCVVFINVILPIWHVPEQAENLIYWKDFPLPLGVSLPLRHLRAPPFDIC